MATEPVEPNSERSDATASNLFLVSCKRMMFYYIFQRSDKKNANTLSIIGAFLSIIGPFSGNLRIAYGPKF